MIRMTLSEYLRKPKDYRGEWTTERWDIPNWEEERKKYMGKRTLMTNIDGATCLVIEGLSIESFMTKPPLHGISILYLLSGFKEIFFTLSLQRDSSLITVHDNLSSFDNLGSSLDKSIEMLFFSSSALTPAIYHSSLCLRARTTYRPG